MKLLTETQREQLLANGRNPEQDHAPAVRFFNPCSLGTCLFSELDSNGDTLFEHCQIDYPELGYASLSEIAAVRRPFGLRTERDLLFSAEHPLSVYVRAARAAGRIVQHGPELDAAAQRADTAADRCPQLCCAWLREEGRPTRMGRIMGSGEGISVACSP